MGDTDNAVTHSNNQNSPRQQITLVHMCRHRDWRCGYRLPLLTALYRRQSTPATQHRHQQHHLYGDSGFRPKHYFSTLLLSYKVSKYEFTIYLKLLLDHALSALPASFITFYNHLIAYSCAAIAYPKISSSFSFSTTSFYGFRPGAGSEPTPRGAASSTPDYSSACFPRYAATG